MTQEVDENNSHSTDVASRSEGSDRVQVVVDIATDDQEFKKSFNQQTLARTTTLRLKASFHLINYIMMSVCDVMMKSALDTQRLPTVDTTSDELDRLVRQTGASLLNPFEFMIKNGARCAYKVKQEHSFNIKVQELAPKIFQAVRRAYNVTDEELLEAFTPVHNAQAIRNF